MTSRHTLRLSVAALMLAVTFFPAPSRARQQPGESLAKQKTTPAAKTKTPRVAAAADPLEEIRRTTAVSLLNSLAEEARNFRQPALRARVQARAADALWETERVRAAALFRRAWEAAEAADAESDRELEEERRAQVAQTGSFVTRGRPDLRREVLRLAARRDRALGEEFLESLDEARKQETSALNNVAAAAPAAPPAAPQSITEQSSNTPPRANRLNPNDPPPAVAQRLRLAAQLLDDGDTERAILFADPVLNSIHIGSVDFLSRLRIKNAQAADERYAALVRRAPLDPASDANTVSLLSSYIFTPALYMTFLRSGGTNSNNFGGDRPVPSDISPQLRAAFFDAAAAIFLRPLPPPDQDKSSAGRGGTYMAIARLTPLFEQHAPDKVAALRARLAMLLPDTKESARDPRTNSALTRGLVPEDPNRDRIQELLDSLDKAKDANERDQIYFNAAQTALRKNDERAREFADKIEDLDLRKQVRAFVDFELLEDAIRAKDADAEAALRLARGGEITHVQRAWALTEVAKLLTKGSPGRAVEVLEEATQEARRIDASSPERVSALVAVATRFLELDRPRAWEILADVVKASNAAPEFTGEDGSVSVAVRSKQQTMISSTGVDSFDLAGVFATLAKDDLDRAVDVARSFKGEHPRAAATLAVARSVLEKKKS